MRGKTITLIIVGFAIAYFIGYIYMKGIKDAATVAANETTGNETLSMFPTISEIMSKGYDQKEAEQILTALKAGRITSY